MVDYSLDENFDVHFTEYDDLAEVEGLEEYEQSLLVKIHFNLSDLIGQGRQSNTVRERVALLAKRLAKENEVAERVANISVREPDDARDTLEIEINYTLNRQFKETI